MINDASYAKSGIDKTAPGRIYDFFRLRPELFHSIISFIAIMIVILSVKWNESADVDEFADLSRFEMVELQAKTDLESEPDIALPEDEVESADEEKMLKFGNDSGKFDLSAMAVTPPKPRVASLPRYPESMKKAGIEGVVVLEVGIDENGSVVYGKIVKSLHPVLDKLVITWARTVSFYPAIDSAGKSFKCKVFWPVRFQLHD
jgi:TonB family protein